MIGHQCRCEVCGETFDQMADQYERLVKENAALQEELNNEIRLREVAVREAQRVYELMNPPAMPQLSPKQERARRWFRIKRWFRTVFARGDNP